MNESLLEIKFTGLAGFKQIRHCVMEYVKARLQGQPSLMEVALNEAVNNAIKHGHAKVKLRLNVIAGKRLVVRVKDQGGGFAVNEQLTRMTTRVDNWQENGRGLMVMQASADYVRYNRRGNEVLLVKNIG